jgi:hypothetical protein
MRLNLACFSCLVLLALETVSATAAETIFLEDFSSDAAGWTNSSNTSFLDHVPDGGSDGGAHVRTQFAFSSGGGAGGSSAVLFRGQDEFHASGDALAGDWDAEGVRQLSAAVWHDAPVPLSFFARISGPLNFPGAVAVAFAPVPSEQWTQLHFDVSPASAQLVSFEGADYGAVFSNVGHLTFGVRIPDELSGDPTLYTFGLDKVSIGIPEPSSIVLLMAGCIAGGLCLWPIGREAKRAGGNP